ncbi:Transglutaminase-like enzyme, putative cysteine protease [Robiginitalea myxolifaciens]|uniref:Transglutaminase-like enzyme, putative cysteine protease n=1 Tax=Robiginitalea myxolifaciens TaxID=400055 RepID=A0A1I6GUU9_9FLAO|nr:transglutaminase family protein [Robiginitalea myxolifaciens]SFR45871.1 Transglutaminase-like enzyme, putative cysteine protease [Robiginitalea myxolifaciens]
MADCFRITYNAENSYDYPVTAATWQFLILPLENESQHHLKFEFSNSLGAYWELSHSGFGFRTIRVRSKGPVSRISFTAEISLIKEVVNPFAFNPEMVPPFNGPELKLQDFRLTFARYIRPTHLTTLPPGSAALYSWDQGEGYLEKLQALNTWVYEYLYYTPGVTDVDTSLEEVLGLNKGVCQDFAHLFIALARNKGIPARYVSGYLHQGKGYFGDAQMHAWAEAWVPGIGWIGFDPTNNILAASNHIKVAHGRDYDDCAPLKGIVFGEGENTSQHAVAVQSQQ